MKRSTSWLVVVVALLMLGGGSQAQQPRPAEPEVQSDPEQQEQPVFRAGINYVRVDVIVTDRRGNPITDLTPEDFEVFEDGKPQEVDSFRLVEFGALAQIDDPPAREIRSSFDLESEAAREDVRLFAIFLDDYHVRRGASMRVREPLINFIRNQLVPSDMIALMYPLTPLSDVMMTRNHEAVIRAIEQFDGRKYDYVPRNQFEERYSNYPASIVERIRNQVSLSALKGLVTHLGGLREGRKAVILVSEGYSNTLPPQLRDPVASMPGLGNPDRHNPFAGEGDLNEQRLEFFNATDLLSDLREVYSAANRNNTAIYALDPRGLAAHEFDINESVGQQTDRRILQATMDTLRTLAAETDGRAIVNQNDLEPGLRQIVRDSSSYYLLGYNSTLAPSDGKFHEIRVRVKRPGVQVRHRRGYWALTAEETAAAIAPPRPGPPTEVMDALASIAEPASRRVIRSWIGTTRAENGRTRVTFVWEPVPASPGTRRENAARVSVTASGADGQPYYRGLVPEAATAAATSAGDAGASGPSKVVFEADPGQLLVRLSVEGDAGQVLDTDQREVEVPDFTAPELALSTPTVMRARNALEMRQLRADPDAVPTARREFHRSERLLIRFETYGPGTSQPEPSARLLSRGGDAMTDLTVRPSEVGERQHQIDLPLAGLAVGEYLIEVKAALDGTEKQELIAIRVTG
jgi:VWFA-related protein